MGTIASRADMSMAEAYTHREKAQDTGWARGGRRKDEEGGRKGEGRMKRGETGKGEREGGREGGGGREGEGRGKGGREGGREGEGRREGEREEGRGRREGEREGGGREGDK